MLEEEGETRHLTLTMEQAVVEEVVISQEAVEGAEEQVAVMVVELVGLHQQW